jgi:hypothetical protein
MALANVIDNIAQIERRLADGCSDKVQIAAIAATYQLLRMELDAVY